MSKDFYGIDVDSFLINSAEACGIPVERLKGLSVDSDKSEHGRGNSTAAILTDFWSSVLGELEKPSDFEDESNDVLNIRGSII